MSFVVGYYEELWVWCTVKRLTSHILTQAVILLVMAGGYSYRFSQASYQLKAVEYIYNLHTIITTVLLSNVLLHLRAEWLVVLRVLVSLSGMMSFSSRHVKRVYGFASWGLLISNVIEWCPSKWGTVKLCNDGWWVIRRGTKKFPWNAGKYLRFAVVPLLPGSGWVLNKCSCARPSYEVYASLLL